MTFNIYNLADIFELSSYSKILLFFLNQTNLVGKKIIFNLIKSYRESEFITLWTSRLGYVLLALHLPH